MKNLLGAAIIAVLTTLSIIGCESNTTTAVSQVAIADWNRDSIELVIDGIIDDQVEAWNDGARALYLKHGYRPSCEKAHSTCTARSCGTADSNPPSETLLLDLPAPESVL